MTTQIVVAGALIADSALLVAQRLRPPELEATDAMLAAFSEIRSSAGLPAELTVIETATAQA